MDHAPAAHVCSLVASQDLKESILGMSSEECPLFIPQDLLTHLSESLGEDISLTLYRAASDPTYLEWGGRIQPAPQFSARGAPIGQMMIPPKTFSVNVVYKKRIGSIGQKLGPWPQFENFRNWPIWPKDRFSRISFRPYKN